MNNTLYFSRAWSAEHIRLKHTWIWKLAAIAPLFVCAMYFCIFYFEGAHFVKDGPAWDVYFSATSRTVFMLFLPLFIILFTLLNQQLDHQSSMRKLLYTLSTPQWAQMTSQWLYTLMVYTATFAGYLTLLLLSGWLLEQLRPDLNFDQFVSPIYFKALFYGYLASTGILAFQFVLSYFFRNMIIPLSIGMAGFISAMVLLNWEHVIYHPFVYPAFAFMNTALQAENGTNPLLSVVFGLGLMVVVLWAGFLLRKKARSES